MIEKPKYMLSPTKEQAMDIYGFTFKRHFRGLTSRECRRGLPV